MHHIKYWNDKYCKLGKIWGTKPSKGAILAVKFLNKNDCPAQLILDIGCGYGRDANYFSKKGHNVVGVDASEEALKIAKQLNKKIDYKTGNITALNLPENHFDVVFGNFVIHDFSNKERIKIISECYRVLKKGGFVIQTLASIEDPDFGKGKKFEDNSFKNKRGIIKHYYSKEGILEEFSKFKNHRIRKIVEAHTHEWPHIHKSFILFAQK